MRRSRNFAAAVIPRQEKGLPKIHAADIAADMEGAVPVAPAGLVEREPIHLDRLHSWNTHDREGAVRELACFRVVRPLNCGKEHSPRSVRRETEGDLGRLRLLQVWLLSVVEVDAALRAARGRRSESASAVFGDAPVENCHERDG